MEKMGSPFFLMINFVLFPLSPFHSKKALAGIMHLLYNKEALNIGFTLAVSTLALIMSFVLFAMGKPHFIGESMILLSFFRWKNFTGLKILNLIIRIVSGD